MCIPHIRLGSYAQELEGGMSAKNYLKIFYMGDFFSLWVCFFFKDAIYLFEREKTDKHVLEGQRAREKQVPC